MQLTVKVKLLPTEEQVEYIGKTMAEYINLVNQVVSNYVTSGRSLKYTSKNVTADLPSAVKNQAIRDAKSVYV